MRTAMKLQTFTTADSLKRAILGLQAAKIESASLDARLLLQEALGASREQLLLRMEQPLPAVAAKRFEAFIARRAVREPVAKIIGRKEFWGMEFEVTHDTLDPRPDSETLIEAVLAALKDRQKSYEILDLGTGTGCLSLALLKELPNAKVKAVDCSEAALSVAKINARNLGLEQKIQFTYSRWFENVDGLFDIMVSNPPYIPTADIERLTPEVAAYDPHVALDGGIDGLSAYRELLKEAPNKLAAKGILAVEIGMGQHVAVAQIASSAGLGQAEMFKDLAGITRCLLWKKQT